MIIIKKLLRGSILLAIILICLTQCKSPVPKQDTVTYPAIDTASVPDTTIIATPVVIDTTAARVPLILLITNLASRTAPVIVGVYDEKCKFPDPKGQLKIYSLKPDSISMTAMIADLPYGFYALAIYQDVNSNGKIDKNLIGVPTEPYAFSNNYKPIIKAPGFKNCRFNYCAATHIIAMKMIK